MTGRRRLVASVALAVATSMVYGGQDDVLSVKRMNIGLAQAMANAALTACRERGYQVSAVVVDRHGIPQVVLRDVYASRFTMQIAEEKANAVVLSGIDSGEFRANRPDIRAEMNHVDGVLMLRGGVAIRSGGQLLGALGVSGAPGGDKDEACARQAVESLRSRLEFAELE